MLALLLTSFISKAAEIIPMWTYYKTLPFSLSQDKKDITHYLARYLSKASKGKWLFKPVYIPRKRIELYLLSGKKGIVAWVNPTWFNDVSEQNYNWSQAIVFDKNLIISNASNPILYQSPESLIGLRFGGVIGHKYQGIDELVSSGAIYREDSSTFAQNIKKLSHKRLDVTLIPESELPYLTNPYVDKFHISKKEHSHYERKLMVTKNIHNMVDFLNKKIDELEQDLHWQRLLPKTHL